MKTYKKQYLALTLAICLLLSAAPVIAFAVTVPEGPVLPDPDAFFRYRLSSERRRTQT